MAVLGLIVIGLEVNLVQFGGIASAPAEEISLALVSRAIGSIIGSFLSGKILNFHSPHFVILETLTCDAALLFVVPFLHSEVGFQFLYFCFGMLIPVTEAAIQFLTCKVHTDGAGPWLQFNNISMWFATMVVPFLHFLLGIRAEYFVLATYTCVVAVILMLIPNPLKILESGNKRNKRFTVVEDDRLDKGNKLQAVEVLVACILFWIYGIVVQTTTYLGSYIHATSIVPNQQIDLVLALFLLCALIGQALAMCLQGSMSTFRLFVNLAWLLLLGVLSMGFILAFPENPAVFWIFVGLFGFSVGPISGYCYDMWNRTCVVSEKGAAFVVFGAYLGSGIFPFVTVVVWTAVVGFPSTLLVANMIGCVVPLFLMSIVWCLAFEEINNVRVSTNA